MSDENLNQKYVPIPISQVKPNEPLCADLYLKINDKYIKYKHEDDVLDPEKYDDLMAKNLKQLYFEKAKLEKVINWLKEIREKQINETVQKVGEENREMVEQSESIAERLIECFVDEELSTETVEHLQSEAEAFIAKISKDAPAAPVIANLRKKNASVADHCVNVANISVFLALVLGHNHFSILENVYLGALFHDYAKAKIPPEILENKSANTYSQAIQDHPLKGKVMLQKIKGITKPVIDIVMQHEEQWNGKGYPLNLKGEDIYGLAQIVSIANVFDNTCEENNRRSEDEMYKAAIKVIEYDRGRRFNPEIMDRVVDALKLAYGNYHRERQKA